jgi:hypothetical protein
MGRAVRLETNSAALLERIRYALEVYGGAARSTRSDFLWRLVTEPDAAFEGQWPEMVAFSDAGLSLVNIGQRSFIAADLDAREVVSFLEERFTKDELGFERLFLAALVTSTAPALGLTPASAACVAQEDRGLLIFAPPRHGKTILGYVASKHGLEFHADDLVFLDSDSRAWGEFWPIAFYEDAAQLLPELLAITRPFSYAGSAYLYLGRGMGNGSAARAVRPVSCVFLELKKGDAMQVARLSQNDVDARLDRNCLVQSGALRPTQAEVLESLRRLPAYHLSYGCDPAQAASLFPRLISGGEP